MLPPCNIAKALVILSRGFCGNGPVQLPAPLKVQAMTSVLRGTQRGSG